MRQHLQVLNVILNLSLITCVGGGSGNPLATQMAAVQSQNSAYASLTLPVVSSAQSPTGSAVQVSGASFAFVFGGTYTRLLSAIPPLMLTTGLVIS